MDQYFAEAPREVQGAAEPAPVDVISVEQLSGPPVFTQQQVESTPWDHGPAGLLSAFPCLGPGLGTPRFESPNGGVLLGADRVWDVATTEEVLQVASRGFTSSVFTYCLS